MTTTNQLALKSGVKMIIYGPPGTYKTMLARTVKDCHMLAFENGLMSLQDVAIPVDTAFNDKDAYALLSRVMKGEFNKKRALYVDSATALAEIVERECTARISHGMQAYGEMAKVCLNFFEWLYNVYPGHVIMTCKEYDKHHQGETISHPGFPGKELSVKVPHMFDVIARSAPVRLQGQRDEQIVLQCTGSRGVVARNRGKLSQYEAPHIDNLIAKLGYK